MSFVTCEQVYPNDCSSHILWGGRIKVIQKKQKKRKKKGVGLVWAEAYASTTN